MTGCIEATLVEAYQFGDFGLATAHENIPFQREQGEPWAAFFFIPNQPSPGSIGPDGEDEHDGIVQIDLNYPIETGRAEVREMIRLIREHFQVGQKFEYEGQEVLITSCGPGRGQQVDKDHRTPVTIGWYARTTRSL